jgi:uncharacterized protein
MHSFADPRAVSGTLSKLSERGLVGRLERRPGQKEDRYAQRLEQDHGAESAPAVADAPGAGHGPAAGVSYGPAERAAREPRTDHEALTLAGLAQRIATLEREVAQLRAASRPAPGGTAPYAPDADASDRLHI